MSWAFRFKKNVHMYSHELKCKKGNLEFNCQSEDSAHEQHVVLFWLDELPLKETQINEFASELTSWAKSQKLNFRVYFNNKCITSSLG